MSKAHQHTVMEATINRLAAEFPAAFSVFERRRRPLAIGIHEAILAASPDLDARTVKIGLRIYTANLGYLRSRIASGPMRIGLDGQPIEPVNAEHRAIAVTKIAAAKAKLAAKAIPQAGGTTMTSAVQVGAASSGSSQASGASKQVAQTSAASGLSRAAQRAGAAQAPRPPAAERLSSPAVVSTTESERPAAKPATPPAAPSPAGPITPRNTGTSLAGLRAAAQERRARQADQSNEGREPQTMGRVS